MLTPGDVYLILGQPYILLDLVDNKGTSGFLPASLRYPGKRWSDPLPRKKMQRELAFIGAVFLGHLGPFNLTEYIRRIMGPVNNVNYAQDWGYVVHYSTHPLNPIYLVQSVTIEHYTFINLTRPDWGGFIYTKNTMRSIYANENNFTPLGRVDSCNLWPCLEPILERRNTNDRV